MLMDLFYDCCPFAQKQRIHFHEFMGTVHKKIHLWKSTSVSRKVIGTTQNYDPIPPVADMIRDDCWLLCFDEFQVTDIGDAMILKRLFEELFQRGIVIVATSNRIPDDLYKHGIQRSQFIPFIDDLKTRCKIINLDSGIDYRRLGADDGLPYFFVHSEVDANSALKLEFRILSSKENDTVRRKELRILGRTVTVERTCGRVADCTFEELCGRPLGAGDYLVLCRVFHTILVRDIPILTKNQLSEARRFITFVDTAYETKTRLVCSADAKPDDLFQISNDEPQTRENRQLLDDLSIITDHGHHDSNLFCGSEEMFAFDRTLSRLVQMQSETYRKIREPT